MSLRAILGTLLLTVAAVTVGQPGPHRDRRPDRGFDIHPLFRKVLENRDKVRLSGVRVLQLLERGERKLITERVWRDGLKTRTEVTAGGAVGMTAVEDSQTRRVWDPRTNEVRESSPRETESLFRFGRMMSKSRERSKLTENEGGRIAGVPTRQLEMAMASGQVLSRVWIDPVRGVVLKLQTFDPKGTLAGSMEFTSVKYETSLPESTFALRKPGARWVTVEEELRQAARQLEFSPCRLPQPWKLVGVRTMRPKDTKILMQTYFNGRARVSLFQIKGGVDGERLRRLGGPETNSHVWNIDGYRLVLIGDLPESQLRQLAGQVRL